MTNFINMKYFTLLFTVTMILTSCQENANDSVADLSKYQLQNIPGTDLKKAIFLDKDNEIVEEGYVLNGLKEGQWSHYNVSGEILLKLENYHKGKLIGHQLKLNARYEMESRTQFLNGLQQGYHAEFKRNRKKVEAYYKNGKRHGRMTQYHDYSDKILSEADYMDGKQHGIYKYYDKSGNVTLDYEYKNGEKVRGGIVEKE